MKKLVIVVDMQKDFIDGALGTSEAVAIVPNVAAYLRELDGDTDVVFTRDTHEADYLKTQEGRKLPVEHCINKTDGWQICAELAEYAGECPIFDKPTFGSVDLMLFVQEQGYEDICLVGLCTDICVISNAMLVKAALPEARISVKADCCAGVTQESHENALAAMKMCQIEIV